MDNRKRQVDLYQEGALVACTCAYLMVGFEPTGSRNWNPDCPEHGLESEWYGCPAQVAKREEDNARLRDLQQRAREARKDRKR